MERLANVSTADLREEVETFENHREITRLLAAIIYTQGPSVPEIAEWLDVREATVYGWFDRLETEPIPDAVRDRDRPGRPSKLTEAEWAQFCTAVSRAPTALGFDGDIWTPDLARQYLAREFGTEYSRRHARRLLHSARSDPV